MNLHLHIAQIEALIEEGKLEEAKNILAEYFKAPVAAHDAARARIALMLASVKVSNAYHRIYVDALKEVTGLVRRINETNSEITERLQLAEVRSNLAA